MKILSYLKQNKMQNEASPHMFKDIFMHIMRIC